MKLVTFRTDAGDRAGVIAGAVDDQVVDLPHAFAWLEHRRGRGHDPARLEARYGRGVLGFIEHAERAREAADAILAAHAAGGLPTVFDGTVLVHPLAGVALRAPLPRPPSLRDGYAFRQHVEAARRGRGLPMIPEFDDAPVFYFSNHGAVVGP